MHSMSRDGVFTVVGDGVDGKERENNPGRLGTYVQEQ